MSRHKVRNTSRNARPRRIREPAGSRIQQIIAVDGWHALYDDDEGPVTMPIVCVALVEMRVPGRPSLQAVRPMIVCDDGGIDDVLHRVGFIGLLPPCTHNHLRDDLEGFDAHADAGIHAVERSTS